MTLDLCTNCLELYAVSCSDTITIDASVTAGSYTAWITDLHGHRYTQDVTVGVDGNITLDLTDAVFPDGSFTAGSKYTLTLSDNDETESRETITVDGSDYTCIVLDFKPLN